MLVLANIIPPLKDEYILSQFMSLADVNAFPGNFSGFMAAFVLKDGQQFRYRTLLNLESTYFAMIQDAGVEANAQLDCLTGNTLYSACAPFMSKSLQSSYVDVYTRRYPKGSLFTESNKSTKHLTEDIRFCPECVRENLDKYGFWHLRTKHQLPGVHVCEKHGTPLRVLSGKVKKLDNTIFPDSQKTYELSDIDEDYVVFIGRLLDMKPDICLDDIRNVLDVSELDFDAGILKYIEDPQKLMRCLSRSGHHEQVPVRDTVIALMYLFGAPENIPFDDIDISKEKAEFEDALAERGYELISDFYRCRPMAIRHKQCGCGHVTTAWNFLHGWGCPACDMDKTDAQIVRGLIDVTGKGRYHLLTDNITSLTEPIEILHDDCGQKKSVKLYRFLSQRYKCKCEQLVGEDEFLERMSIVNPDIEFLSSYTGYTEKIRCRCKKCGHEWNAPPARLLTGVGCPNIYSHEDYVCPHKYTTDDFRKRLAEVRPDLELIGEYTGSKNKIKVRCRICGAEFTSSADNIRKRKCPNEHEHEDK